MKKTLILLFILISYKTYSQTKTIHVYVALCDNEFQGIVPVPKKLGNGKDPYNNLYWGAAYGVKSFLKYKSKNWKLVAKLSTQNSNILERVLFKHISKDAYLLADAYDGEKIKNCTQDFLLASNQQKKETINFQSKTLSFGGTANLISYIGHDGLMEFNVNLNYQNTSPKKNDVIILACYSKHFFSDHIKKAGANPILWTTNLMAPEAYTLTAAVKGWLSNAPASTIHEKVAKAYHKYQKCGLKGARNLFSVKF
ncbi:hypothetical protein [Tenacibaculum jejuense]|uniref:Uncharacterized protein n=1 Tax=Tenacibaculum jejuense TaxID=584609 RepID=A0A238U6H5_9FLAO|nr:hypothetical protein [Tenacibaculum jejuense]SNR14606.1 conserved protein of unknown function [Tenacibaculum jejuense]